MRKTPRVGEQLELELHDCRSSSSAPWGGQSPRELTGAFKRFSLKALPAPGLREVACLPARNEELQLVVQLELPFKEV